MSSGIKARAQGEFDLGTYVGSFEIEMQLLTDDTFTTQVASDFVVHTPEMIYVGLGLPRNENFILQSKKCWATARFGFINSNLYKPILAKMRMMLFNTSFWMTFVQLRHRTSLRCTATLSLPWFNLLFNHLHLLLT